jgi:hypothetical protein
MEGITNGFLGLFLNVFTMSQVEHNFNFISWCILDEIWRGLQVVSCIKLMHFKNSNGITSLNLELDSHNPSIFLEGVR